MSDLHFSFSKRKQQIDTVTVIGIVPWSTICSIAISKTKTFANLTSKVSWNNYCKITLIVQLETSFNCCFWSQGISREVQSMIQKFPKMAKSTISNWLKFRYAHLFFQLTLCCLFKIDCGIAEGAEEDKEPPKPLH